jgi:hypothetical protein
VAIAVYEADSLAGCVQPSTAKLCHQFGRIAATDYMVKRFAGHRAAQQRGYCSQVSRVVCPRESDRRGKIRLRFVIPKSPLRLGRCGGFFHAATLFAWASRNCLTSPTRQAVTRSDNFTGFGNWPALHFLHSVADENGTTSGMSCACRMKPVAGRLSKVEAVIVAMKFRCM